MFNTLSIINIQAKEIQADDISKSIVALSGFYRLSLSDGNSFITLRQEIMMLTHYITICKTYYRDRLQVQMDISDNLLDCYLPKMILQPFIENAVFHGFNPGMEKEPMIEISAKKSEEKLIIVIIDNGKGIQKNGCIHIMQGQGYAISNINRRIKLIYGEDYGVQITSIVDQYTRVEITIPYVLTRDP